MVNVRLLDFLRSHPSVFVIAGALPEVGTTHVPFPSPGGDTVAFVTTASRHPRPHEELRFHPEYRILLSMISDSEYVSSQAPAVEPYGSIPEQHCLRRKLQVGLVSAPTPALRRAPPAVVGHRGALYAALENTREGFRLCAQWGCDAVELDVFFLPKDKSLVVFHGGGTDDNPGDLSDYCLNQHGISILDLTFDQIQELEFNPSFAEFPCPANAIHSGKIPTLEQVLLDLRDTKTKVKIELKGPNTVEPVLEVVERLGMVGHCSYSSFDLDRLQQLRRLRPDQTKYPSGALFARVPDNYIPLAREAGATEIHLQYDACSVERIRAIHEAGFRSMAWFRGPIGMKLDTTEKYVDIGNEDANCYQAVLDTGVDELCVNRPDLLINLIREKASR